jgi:hypothetical protein
MAKRNRQSSPQLGHLNLKVSDLDRAVDFYRALGLRVVRRAPGASIAFLGLEQPGAFQLGLGVAEVLPVRILRIDQDWITSPLRTRRRRRSPMPARRCSTEAWHLSRGTSTASASLSISQTSTATAWSCTTSTRRSGGHPRASGSARARSTSTRFSLWQDARTEVERSPNRQEGLIPARPGRAMRATEPCARARHLT